MPITKSAKKVLRASVRKKTFNDRRRRVMRETVKGVKKLITEKKHKNAAELLPSAYKAIDKAAKRGIIKKNTAARKKSRLTLLVNKSS
tara:strand:+ start:1096 stop:1359 length:264 start_codon:yes stop_codon:yes gene_type:complete